MNASEQLLPPFERKSVIAPASTADNTPLPAPSVQSFEELEIPASFRTALDNELTDGEKVLWLGRPSRNPQVHPQNPMLTPIGVGLLIVAVVAAMAAIISGAGAFPLVFAAFLGLFGFVFLLPRLLGPSKSCRSCYVVTNRRAMLIELSVWGRAPRAKSYLPHELVA
ncbi:MAG: hypothetical protein ACJ8FY_18875 [Gemmataceae bacterium]